MKIFFNIFLNFLFLLFLVIITSANIIGLKGEAFGYKVLPILNDNMKPTIPKGSLLIGNSGEIKPGDIITYSYSDTKYYTTKRVIEVLEHNNEKQYITKADNHNTEDLVPVNIKDIKFKCIAVLPNVGFVIDFCTRNYGLLFGSSLVIYFWIWFSVRHKKDKKKFEY